MKSLYIVFTIFVSIFFTACGGGGGSSSSTASSTSATSSNTISGYLIDSAISGVDYTCASISSTTTSEGKFTCEKDSTVYFSIGGINLGSYVITNDEEILTPAKLYGLEEDNISDRRLLNFIQLLQSLDSDLDSSNGISISDDVKSSLANYDLDLSDNTITENQIETLLNDLGLDLISSTLALNHYVSVLSEELEIEVSGYDLTAPVFTSSSEVTVEENQTSVLTVTATDENEITFSLSGTDADSFTLNSSTGVIVFNTIPVYDTKNSYVIIVTATDSYLNSTSQTITINISEIITYQNEPLISQQWAILKDEDFYSENSIDDDAHIHPENLYKTYTGSGIKIAIIDNGFDVDHEDIKDGVISTYDLKTGTSDVSHNESDEYHGTSVSGIAAARENSLGIKGIASSAELILIKYNDDGMSDSDFITLFEKADELGADVVNCSWGTGFVSTAVKEKIQELATSGRDGKGLSIVFSSGNDDSDMANDESNIEEVISVGATDKDNLRTYYSNYGKNLDIVAPGGYYLGITTLDVSGTNGGSSSDYLEFDDSNYFIGTSASAPIVTGVIALMLEKNPDLTRVEIENLLKNNADKIGSLPYNSDDRNNYYGYGKINLSSIMENID